MSHPSEKRDGRYTTPKGDPDPGVRMPMYKHRRHLKAKNAHLRGEL